MVRLMSLALGFTVWAAGLATKAGQPADANVDLGSNAALKYWQAFASLPRLDKEQQEKIKAESLTMPLDARVKDLVAASGPALGEMHHGATLPQCAWGVSIEDGLFAEVQHTPAARLLAGVACLRVRIRFEEGRHAEALDDVIAAMTLGRHLSLDGTLLAVLMGNAIERLMTEVAAVYLPNLDATALKRFAARLDSLPAGGNMATAIMTAELKGGLDWFVCKVKEAKDKDRLLEFLTSITRSRPRSREEAEAFLDACCGNAEGILKFAEATRPFYAVFAKKMELPLDQFEKEWDPLVEKTSAANPVFKLLFPALGKCRQAQAHMEGRRAMRKAAIAILLDGPNALKAHPDPFGSGPFEYVAFEGGFELRSKLKIKDAALSLTVGQRKEK